MTTVGREDAPRRCDIILHGPGMAKEHCVIKYTDNGVYLQPHFQALCAVNGADISSSTKLTQGTLLGMGSPLLKGLYKCIYVSLFICLQHVVCTD